MGTLGGGNRFIELDVDKESVFYKASHFCFACNNKYFEYICTVKLQ